jgi:ribosomal-protein-alanine N-acetyltransferase
MSVSDLESVLEIEKQGFRASWTESMFREELEREWAYVDVVRLQHGRSKRVVAFCNYWLVTDEVQLLNVATHGDHRRSGFAALLMRHMLSFAVRQACRLVTLEVRRSNEAAIRLYEQFGFVTVGIRSNYYAAYGEDALVMVLELRS